MKQMQCDTVVIGAGSAGLAAFRKASENGALCILVDQGPLGTSAQRSGELPLSLLMSAGEALYSASHLENFGIETINSSSFNIDKVLNSLRAVRSRATSEVLSFLYKIPEERRLRGQASFLDAHTIRVEECEVKFKTAIIATGSSPLVTYDPFISSYFWIFIKRIADRSGFILFGCRCSSFRTEKTLGSFR